MSYADHWREHVLPRCHLTARWLAIGVVYGHGPTLHPICFSDAIDQTMAFAMKWGAHRLTDPVFRDLEEHLAAYILSTIDQLEARNVR